ncbi:MAG TPA: hypothetical protein VFN78_04650 [Ktedonobacterales bacterium]|nr:hypothetical protein [Ktedonobacterales bacterium]
MRPSDTIPGVPGRKRRSSLAHTRQGAHLLRRNVLAHHQPQRARPRHRRRPRYYPFRYAPVVLGSALMLLGGLLSLPLGYASSSPPRAVLTLFCSVAGLALLMLGGLRLPVARSWRQRAMRRKGSFMALGGLMTLLTLLVFVGGVRLTMGGSLSRAFWSDVISFSYVNARLVLQGHNPYVSDPAFFPTLERFPYAIETPLRAGAFGHGFDYPSMPHLNEVEGQFLASPSARNGEFDPATLHSYPALSFLLYVPLVWAGIDNILVLNVAVFLALFAWQVWLAPQGERHWGALVAGSVAGLALFSLFLDNEVICLAFLLLAWHYRRHRWVSGALLGLGCAFKQYCWFFAPFFILDALLSGRRGATTSHPEPGVALSLRERASLAVDELRRLNWGDASLRVAITLVGFLVPNLPYLIASPGAWWASLWLPQSEPLFPMGMGVIALFTGHLLPYIAPRFFTLMELLGMGAALFAAVRWRRYLGDATLLLGLVPLLFAFRSLPNYFGVAPWIALYAANMAYRAYASKQAISVRLAGASRTGQPTRRSRSSAQLAR